MKDKIVLILLLVVILIFCLLLSEKSTVRAGESDLITGWGWSPSVGWLSMNCYNEYSDQKENRCTYDYGVTVEDNEDPDPDNIVGYAWSPYAGWLCFGKTCSGIDGLGSTPNGSDPEIVIRESGLLEGWANWVSFGSNGWLKLLGNDLPDGPFNGIFYSCLNCNEDGCGVCFASDDYEGSGNVYENCTECSGTNCVVCEKGFEYGTALYKAKNILLGWAWNSYDTELGLGWLHFIEDVGLYPYIETLYGDIYAKQGIQSIQAPPPGRYNATFMIQSGGDIEKFYSEYELTQSIDWKQEYFDQLEFPKSETKYRSSIGDLDLSGLFAGQYGPVEVINGDSNQIPNMLGGKVYYSNSDLILNTKQFNNGLPPNQKASGTIVVKGDLYIDGDLNYQQDISSFAKLKNIASVGILVLKDDQGQGGNIYIDPDIEEVVGNYYAEGRIYTGTNDPDVDVQLKIEGLMIATGFELERQFIDSVTKEPAEKVIYDRKAVINPPPGFSDIIQALPDWYK